MINRRDVIFYKHIALVLISLVAILASCQSNSGNSKSDKDTVQTATDIDTAKSAQLLSTDPEPAPIDISQYKENIAPFKIRLVDGKGFTYKDLVKNKAIILVYFQPDCPECQAFTAELAKRANQLMEKQIVMISFAAIRDVKQFAHHYQLSGHPNIKIGSEGYTFVVQQYYQINHFPFVASYNKAGKLVQILNPNLKADAMAAKL